MSVDQDPIVSSEPSPTSHLEVPPHNRKVSIIEGLHGHDNLAFESPRSRKVSANSEHAEIGPVRKKSILHNAHPVENLSLSAHTDQGKEEIKRTKSYCCYVVPAWDSGKQVNGDLRSKKNSVTESLHSKTRFSETGEEENDDRSWWYLFCLKCRQEETHPSWQPPVWPRICPYPFCPTYRQFSRMIALALIGTLSWCILYAIVGATAAPGGHLFQLILLCICAHFGGWLMSLTTLPALIGMLFTGMLLQNLGIVNIDDSFAHITKELRHVALVIILIRAGLDLEPDALKRLKFTVIKLGLGPWVVETGIVAVLSRYFLDLPWDFALLLATIVAAVSPAVVVPCLFRLRTRGYGVAKGIPTLIIAVAGIDDAVSVAIFGIVKSIMFSNDSLTFQILQGPISVLGGLGFGLLWGIICNYAPERHDPFMVPLRVLLLLVGGMISVFGSELIGYGGAGPLACVSVAFVSLYCWSRQGWEIEDNPAATAFEIFWMIFEPVLFSITGAQVKLDELDGYIVSIGVAILIAGIVIRIAVTVLLGIGCKLNLKEKIFVALAWMSKATVQAALGPLTLGVVKENTEEHDYAEKILMVCVMSIILTAPTGAILIILGGPRLLTKTKFPEVPEGWRRSHRPSIRDISIIDEEEERDENVEASMSTTVSQKDSPKGET
ncbi:sodium/hydrogen exchanger 9B2 isoform X2 [Tribolium castaneum]|nr:PREDICTED: mitochondrial sodium/hydrogen exchanger 9B2 isoform X2 [Tribolium castaneum]|eukprot:XP_015835932.1 PREDICTED: mitochondrial sodium/hydrogen exchanger 9B2 isoform X2 [Tribolium castaneum]